MLNDYLARIILAAIGAAVLALLGLGWWAWTKKIKPWLDVRLTISQRELIDRIARDGYAWVEANFPGTGGEKFEKACEWLSTKLAHIGVKIPAEELEAAVQKAWEEFNASKSTTAPVITVNMTGTSDKAQANQIIEEIKDRL